MGILHVLHVVLHSPLKGHHCLEKGFAAAAKVHGYERTIFGTVKPAVVHPTFGQSSAVCPTQAQDTTEEHVPPSCTSWAICLQTYAASSLRSSPAVQRDSLRAPQQASCCVPAGPEPARAASAPRNCPFLADSVLPTTRFRDKNQNAAQAARDGPKWVQEFERSCVQAPLVLFSLSKPSAHHELVKTLRSKAKQHKLLKEEQQDHCYI